MKNWLIIYDIRDEKRLVKVAKELSNYGVRVQKSVFEAIASDKKIGELRKKLQNIVEKEDYIVYFDICHKDWLKQEKYGPGVFELLDEKDYEIF